MNTRDNSESRELTPDELNHVSGGVVCITATHPAVQPLPIASGVYSDYGSGGGTGKIIIEGG
jgi:hypothetical protein